MLVWLQYESGVNKSICTEFHERFKWKRHTICSARSFVMCHPKIGVSGNVHVEGHCRILLEALWGSDRALCCATVGAPRVAPALPVVLLRVTVGSSLEHDLDSFINCGANMLAAVWKIYSILTMQNDVHFLHVRAEQECEFPAGCSSW